ncbi:OstA-like protein [Selenomonas sp. GACV-9]|uniref:LptA/OstA family protein n=1 Tax=Selenomonas sp. GACV-9 TaxID=3158782 RepID=UPI0008F38A47|nr:OstA-like protein [Selenomonas ruminantium]
MKHFPLLLAATALGLLALSAPQPATAAPRTITMSITDNIIKGRDKAIVTADHSDYNESTARYTLQGNVKIQFGNRTILTDAAKISTQTLQLWTEGNTKLNEGELCFSGGAVYAELAGNVAWFFGPNCSLERPGLAIHSDNMAYHWDKQTAVFDGHVICIYKGEHRAAAHLEFDLANDEIH